MHSKYVCGVKVMIQIPIGTLQLRVSGILPNMRNIQVQKKTENKQEPD
jgi:hypothetical protein